MLEKIKDIFKTDEEKIFKKLRQDIVSQAHAIDGWRIAVKTIGKTASVQKKLLEGEDYCKRFIEYCCADLECSFRDFSDIDNTNKIIECFLQESSLNWSCDEILRIIKVTKHFSTDGGYYFNFPLTYCLDFFDAYFGENSISEDVIKAISRFKYSNPYRKEEKVINEKINALLAKGKVFKLSEKEFNSEAINDFLLSCPNDVREKWVVLLKNCRDAGMKSEPTKKWLQETKQWIEKEMTVTIFSQQMQVFLGQGTDYLKEKHKAEVTKSLTEEITGKQQFVFKALIWNCGIAGEKELHQLLFDFALWGMKKHKVYFPMAKTSAIAVFSTFANLSVEEGVPRLVALKNKTTDKTIIASIQKQIRESAKNNKISLDNIEEISIPTYSMREVGVLEMPFGDFQSRTIFEANGKNKTTWDSNGKIQASVPMAVKNEFSTALRKFKATIKEIEQLIPSQRNRIEKQYLAPVSWTYEAWFSLYITHPIVGILGQKLIWNVAENGVVSQVIFNEHQFENVKGEVLQIANDAIISLWHPIGFDENQISNWRNYLMEKQIVQPFKQAFREIYIVTDAELNTELYSNRFAAHILRQHQFTALTKLRDWSYKLQGEWDSHNTPYKKLPHWNIRAEYFVDGILGEVSPAGVFNYITTDQVRFSNGQQVIPMAEVPAMVFTEIMRDVDMYVGVCSIGNDPNWVNNPDQNHHHDYWRGYAFGDLSENANAKVRIAVLKNLVPRLKIASKCTFEGNFLVVKGTIRTYKIHLGSGNIKMTPNDQYLCIVPDSSNKKSNEKVFLPFEGDSILSIIISKALMLADDKKITDSTIIRQIK